MSIFSLPSGHRNDDRRAWGNAPIAAVRGRHIHARFPDSVACPNLPRQRQLGGGKRTDSAVFHSHPQRVPSPLLRRNREVEQLPSFRSLTVFHQLFQQHGVNVFEPDFAQLPHVSRLSCVGDPNEDHSTRRHPVNVQEVSGDRQNV